MNEKLFYNALKKCLEEIKEATWQGNVILPGFMEKFCKEMNEHLEKFKELPSTKELYEIEKCLFGLRVMIEKGEIEFRSIVADCHLRMEGAVASFMELTGGYEGSGRLREIRELMKEEAKH